jgi:hypothetical protein
MDCKSGDKCLYRISIPSNGNIINKIFEVMITFFYKSNIQNLLDINL